MKTKTNKKITATPNYKLRTFTIRTESGKYRTGKQSNEDFIFLLENTASD